jgi:protein SCO1/2
MTKGNWIARARVAAACALLALPFLTHAAIPEHERIRALTAPSSMGEAALTNQNGERVALSSLRGSVTFLLFGYTNCPDACPTGMERLRELHDSGAIPREVKVKYVLVSVDGDRDTPAAMKTYLAKYSKDFIGLTATPAAVKPIAARFSASFFAGAHDHADHYTVAHSPQIFVVDPAGNIRAEVFGASLDAMADVARALNAE